MELTAPYDNPFQGPYHRALFVCSAGLLRSATAANHFAKRGWNTRAAGSAEYALVPVSTNLLAWAHRVYFVNQENWDEVWIRFGNKFPTKLRDALVMDIPDAYDYNHPDLIKSLEDQIDN